MNILGIYGGITAGQHDAAAASFAGTGIDYLIMENYFLEK